MPEPRAIVVGAGISGLTAAWRLQQRGVETTVLEAEPHVGGKMHSIERDGYRINTGAGIYSGSYKSLLGVVDELGLSASITTPLNTIGIVKDGTPHYIRGDGMGALVDFVRTPLISPRSKLLLTRLVWDSLRNRGKVGYAEAAGRAELDTESVADYCDRRLNAELRDRFIGPLLGGVWVLDGREMSVADLYFLVARFLGGGLRGYRGGTDFVARALAERLDVRTSAPVSLVERTDDGARVVWSEDGTERDEQVDGAILTVCAPHVPPIYPGLEPELQGILLEGLPQASYGTLRVALDRSPRCRGGVPLRPHRRALADRDRGLRAPDLARRRASGHGPARGVPLPRVGEHPDGAQRRGVDRRRAARARPADSRGWPKP